MLDRPLEIREQSVAEFRAALDAMPVDDLDYLVAMTGSPTAADRAVSSVVADLTGRPPRTFREWATRHREDLC